jgi:hypothetical protein
VTAHEIEAAVELPRLPHVACNPCERWTQLAAASRVFARADKAGQDRR